MLATAWRGLGKRLIAHATSANMRRLHNVIGCPLTINKVRSGMFTPETEMYPKNQSMIKTTIIAANMQRLYHLLIKKMLQMSKNLGRIFLRGILNNI